MLVSAFLLALAAIGMTMSDWYLARQALIEDTEAESEVWVGEFAHEHAREMDQFLADRTDAPVGQVLNRLPARLGSAIAELMESDDVVKVEIFDRAGRLAYSSDPNARSGGRAPGPALRAALEGESVSQLLRKGQLDRNDSTRAPESVVRSYVPIELDDRSGVDGVVAVDTDVGKLSALLARTRWRLLFEGVIGFSLLGAALYGLFRRVGRVMDSEQRAVEQARSDLTRASVRVLSSEDASREKIARDLDAGIVQTLSAVKLLIEDLIEKAYKGNLSSSNPALKSIIPEMQGIMDSLLALAAELRPASLQHLGLLPVLKRVCDAFRQAHPTVQLDWSFDLDETLIPEYLRPTVYRTLQSLLECAGRSLAHGRIDVHLATKRQDLALRVNLYRAQALEDAEATHKEDLREDGAWLEQAAARVMLSGGRFSVESHDAVPLHILAQWPLGAVRSAAAAADA